MQLKIFIKFLLIIVLSFSIGLFAKQFGLNNHQSLSLAILLVSILGTLFFWDFRLSFAFLGSGILLLTRAIDLENFIQFASVDVILFLIGMMVLMGLLKESGFFAWIVSLILRIRNLTAKKFLITSCVMSALLACAIAEVTSIIFMVAAILEICDYYEVKPTPFIISSILATNIGSSGTVLGNPIGILIAAKSGLSFEDFAVKAFPLMVLCLIFAIALLLIWYRKPLKQLDIKMKEFASNEMLLKLISVPPDRQLKRSLWVFGITLFFIAIHRRLEIFLGLRPNTALLIIPLISAGLVMIWQWKKARKFIEKDVEWWTLLFFLLLFAQAGTLKFTGATDIFAHRLSDLIRHNPSNLMSLTLWVAALGSSILDNVVLVAAFIPVVYSFGALGFNIHTLWWALLFGGCFGGNITMIGSTANIVALDILGKERNIKIQFFHWLGIGLFVGLITTFIIWMALLFLPVYR